MTDDDRKMLELAAKAMGRKIIGWNARNNEYVAILDDGSYWQPLIENHITDCMGDALRLAVKLRILFRNPPSMKNWVRASGAIWNGDVLVRKVVADEQTHDDPYAATRRAIVRAAAEIGKEMK